MRPIKFRAWDKENTQMKVVNELDFLYEKSQRMAWGMQGTLTDAWLNGECESYTLADVVLLQYTGLKDKNEVEIYEHDIDKMRFEDENHNLIAEEINVVIYEEIGAFAFAPSLKHRGLTISDFWHRYKGARYITHEIIGNIYQSPELLGVNESGKISGNVAGETV